jgi:hypothetical protein
MNRAIGAPVSDPARSCGLTPTRRLGDRRCGEELAQCKGARFCACKLQSHARQNLTKIDSFFGTLAALTRGAVTEIFVADEDSLF